MLHKLFARVHVFFLRRAQEFGGYCRYGIAGVETTLVLYVTTTLGIFGC